MKRTLRLIGLNTDITIELTPDQHIVLEKFDNTSHEAVTSTFDAMFEAIELRKS